MKTARFRIHLLVGLVLLAVSVGGHGRDLDVDDDELVRVEIATLGMAAGGTPVVLLREPEGRRVLPIFIGPSEAGAIARGMRGESLPRPLTHDLLGNVLAGLDARLARVIVDDLADDTFFGLLELDVEGRDEAVRIDSRPSDAMALAVRTDAEIYVTEAVMEAAEAIEYRVLGDQPVTAAGITVIAVTSELREALDLPDRDGLVVSEVTGPAAEAGMAAGALLLSVGGDTPGSPAEFLDQVQQAGTDAIEIEYWQEGEVRAIEVPADVPDPERGTLPAPGEGIDL